ncbi:IS30 family transposase [Mycoplasma phocoeninasale]|uniref:IS30 family transposase n=1 Tax=Mycoplasma phocoeninasale TaxID=2726117 RepID=A0A858U614_9MOLU|nr:IS30 family transposase [Mycoplasma phocoeninasale]MBN0970414.1 IS30 family transposase [Mycoplasma phocoeninasale]QJG66705.1 IS30 family transposase [Mycoplasma phocoeninasale]
MHYNIRKYKHITNDERILIQTYMQKSMPIKMIALELNRNVSTIWRELKRNTSYEGNYAANIPCFKALKRHKHKYLFKFEIDQKIIDFTKEFIKFYDKRYHGVKATYNKIKNYFNFKNIPSIRTIFNWIRTNKWTITKDNRLRQYYKKDGKRTSNVIQRLVPNEYVFPIWARSKHIDLREEYGHWELDLIIGKRASGFNNIITLTERKTKVGFAALIKSKDPMKVNSEVKKLVEKNHLEVKSITIDNGIEFEKIGLLAKWIGAIIYKAEPYASFQRGSNENFNGLIRRMWKKGFDFNQITEENLKNVIRDINNMPREILNYETSYDHFMRENFGVIK